MFVERRFIFQKDKAPSGRHVFEKETGRSYGAQLIYSQLLY